MTAAAQGHHLAARPRTRLRTTIGVKMGLLLAALLAVLVAASTALVLENQATARGFDQIFNREVRQAQLARQMQVEFTERVQEWKDILLRGSDPADLARYRAGFEARDRKVHALYGQLLSSDPDPALRGQLQRWLQLERTADTEYAAALDAFVDSRGRAAAAADTRVRGVDRPVTAAADQIVGGLEAQIAREIVAQERLIEARQRLTLIAAGCLLVLLTSLLGLALIRIVRPIRELTRQADEVATEHLPAAIAVVKVQGRRDAAPALPPFEVRTSDELRELARALTSLQDSALAQALEQRRADRETADMLVNLGRRNQNLLGRMLSYVTELERKETDPDVLAQLFRLDHATTRIRRNAESMLVLAGATQTRTWSRPVPVIDVVRAALSEIEEYARVDVHHVEEALVNGSAVADLVHLVAELVENATHFSPPTAKVTVIGQRAGDGYRLRVVDAGVGMTHRELDEANQRIHRVDGGWADTKLLGLIVVGKLARRRGVEVALEASAGRGITASIELPAPLLAASGNRTPGAPLTGAPLTGAPLTGGLPAVSAGLPLGRSAAGRARTSTPAPASAPIPAAPRSPLGTAPAAAASDPAAAPAPAPAPAAAGVGSAGVGSAGVGSGDRGSGGRGSGDRGSGDRGSGDRGFGGRGSGGVGPAVVGPAVVPAPAAPPTPVPGALGGPPRRGTLPDARRTIDLTDGAESGHGAGDPIITGQVPVQWFKDGVPSAGAPATGASPTEASPAGAAPSGTAASRAGVPPTIPRRVRGAQLPDLGPGAVPSGARPVEGPGAPESLRWQLRSFQLDVQAARRAIDEDATGQGHQDDEKDK